MREGRRRPGRSSRRRPLSTTGMPLPAASAPGPPTLVTRTVVVAGSRAAADDQFVGGRVVAAQESVGGQRAAGAGIGAMYGERAHRRARATPAWRCRAQ